MPGWEAFWHAQVTASPASRPSGWACSGFLISPLALDFQGSSRLRGLVYNEMPFGLRRVRSAAVLADQIQHHQPKRMCFPRHQLIDTFTHLLGNPPAQGRTVVQEKLQKVHELSSELSAQREIVAQPGIPVLSWRTALRRFGFAVQCVQYAGGIAFLAYLCTEQAPTNPIVGRSF